MGSHTVLMWYHSHSHTPPLVILQYLSGKNWVLSPCQQSRSFARWYRYYNKLCFESEYKYKAVDEHTQQIRKLLHPLLILTYICFVLLHYKIFSQNSWIFYWTFLILARTMLTRDFVEPFEETLEVWVFLLLQGTNRNTNCENSGLVKGISMHEDSRLQ